MSAKASAWASWQTVGAPGSGIVLMRLAYDADDSGFVRGVSIESLARLAFVCEMPFSGVLEALQALYDADLVALQRRGDVLGWRLALGERSA